MKPGLTLAQKLILLCAGLLAAALLIGFLGYRTGQDMLAHFRQTNDVRIQGLIELMRIREAGIIATSETAHKLADGSMSWADGQKRLENAESTMKTNWEAFSRSLTEGDERRLAEGVQHDLEQAEEALARLRLIVRQEDRPALQAFIAETLYPIIDPVNEGLKALAKLQQEGAREAFNEAHEAFTNETREDLVIMLLALGLGTSLALAIIRNLTRTLGGEPGDVARIAGRIAAGNLREPVPVSAGDRDSVMAAMSSMQDALRRLIGKIDESSVHVSAAADELQRAADLVSTSAGVQSEASSAIAAAMEEMAASIELISGHSSGASRSAAQSLGHASSAVTAVRNTAGDVDRIARTVTTSASTMAQLSAQSEQIASVLMVIREVADQTNLLALNAAIEAARAGEQGRGFAVVADEVRKLAERTARSTGEIAEVITAIQAAGQSTRASIEEANRLAASGAGRAGTACEAISHIEEEAGALGRMITEISHALVEQKNASQDISRRLESVSQMTEENHGVARSVQASARSLAESALQLKSTVRQFAC
ncbi:methyl-accepting chemotaxis protein [Uliginosibacterium paludis]|uniref:Methyl-accepting chemotaxis protein n=1 Tax=Uliginosibacterium paludis TaxID=1615952 RepID=A0ABV2CQH4_9RHOO